VQVGLSMRPIKSEWSYATTHRWRHLASINCRLPRAINFRFDTWRHCRQWQRLQRLVDWV